MRLLSLISVYVEFNKKKIERKKHSDFSHPQVLSSILYSSYYVVIAGSALIRDTKAKYEKKTKTKNHQQQK